MSTSNQQWITEVFTYMCRLLGYVSPEKASFDSIVGEDFPEFIALSSVHCDGWGIATINHDEDSAHLDRAPETASTSQGFVDALANVDADGALLHLRWATKGLPVSEDNTHPFAYEDFTFIHNGAIFPPSVMDPYISPKFATLIQGDTDSERYFYFLMTMIEKYGFLEGVKKCVKTITSSMDYSSINAMILNEDRYIVICEHHPERHPDWAPADYYALKYRQDENGILVASTGWNQPGWTLLENHHLLVVDRQTFATQLLPI
ncbi:MAG TPA: class II glutamine amidotransferase [Candidatus Nanopelagicaceae bacterium]